MDAGVVVENADGDGVRAVVGVGVAGSLPYASTLCGACYDACPVKIDIPRMLLHLRSRVVEEVDRPKSVWVSIAARTAERIGARDTEQGSGALIQTQSDLGVFRRWVEVTFDRAWAQRAARPSEPSAADTPSDSTDPKLAAELDRKFAQTGKLVGPLHGVVIAIYGMGSVLGPIVGPVAAKVLFSGLAQRAVCRTTQPDRGAGSGSRVVRSQGVQLGKLSTQRVDKVSPLAVTIGPQNGDRVPDECQPCPADVNCDRVIDMVDTLIEVSRIEQGSAAATLHVQTLDVREVLEEHGLRGGYGAARIRQDLERRQVADAVIEEALTLLEDRDEEAAARELAKRRLAQLPSGLAPEAAARRLVGYLTRRGHPPGLAQRVAISVSGLDHRWD